MTDDRHLRALDDPRPTALYVAGPMRGIADFNFPAFDQAAADLRGVGYTCFNPAERDREVHDAEVFVSPTGNDQEAEAKGFSLREALAADMEFIALTSDGIAVLPGWEASKGAQAETALARALGLPVRPVDEWLALTVPGGVTYADAAAVTDGWGEPGFFVLDEAHGDRMPPAARRAMSNTEAIDRLLAEEYAYATTDWRALAPTGAPPARFTLDEDDHFDTLPTGIGALSGAWEIDLTPKAARKFEALFDAIDAAAEQYPEPGLNGERRVTSTTGGQKGTKPARFDLVPSGPLTLLATLFGAGASKYADHNWRKGYPMSLSYAAAQRHMLAHNDGETYDPEMTAMSASIGGPPIPHVTCAAFHMFVIAEHLLHAEQYGTFDDRYVR